MTDKEFKQLKKKENDGLNFLDLEINFSVCHLRGKSVFSQYSLFAHVNIIIKRRVQEQSKKKRNYTNIAYSTRNETIYYISKY